MNSTIFIVPSALANALNVWQDWSDAIFDAKYRAAILTLIEGLATLVGYLIGSVCCWLLLQIVRAFCYWLAAAAQTVPVLNGWWVAPFVEITATQYPERCWQAITPAVTNAILNDELDWAIAAEDVPIDIS